MSEVKLARIVSVSSEDPKALAKSLCGPVGSGKWKTARAGEKQAIVIVQLQKPAKITGLHVGNECSAFVEVFVGKESTHSDQDWQVLLVASSFMAPSDARTNTNTHKVRLFQEDSLVKSARGQTWDRAKIVCTQPFNKSITYGLSFISFLSDDTSGSEQSKATEPASQPEKLGAFTLLGDDSDDNLSMGTMFSQRKRIQASEPLPTAAAAVREAARLADDKVGVAKTDSSPASKKSWPDYPKPDEKSKESKASKPAPSTSQDNKSSKPKKSTTKSYDSSKPVQPSSRTPDERSENTSKHSTGTTPKTSAAASAKSIKQIMKDVTFSLSGFKNPKRSDLREKAQELGARFSPDWTNKCTHLVCAFKNTPKFSQVNGKGYIVTENWILDSYKEKEKLPWRLYRLSNAKSPPGSDNEQEELSKPSSSSAFHASDSRDTRQTKSGDTSTSTKSTKNSDPYLSSTDVDSDEDIQPPSKKAKALSDSDWSGEGSEESMDTDDEIAAHLAGNSPVKKADKLDTATFSSGDKPLPVLPNFVEGKVFFFYGEVNDRRLVNRYINAYGGEVEDYMCDSVNYVVTDSEWDENFDSALSDNPDLVFIKSKWIMDIHQQQRKIPYQKYAIVPK